jgi:hypothetical protein
MIETAKIVGAGLFVILTWGIVAGVQEYRRITKEMRNRRG